MEIRIALDRTQTQRDERDPRHQRVDGAYALWTAGSQQDGTPKADRRQAGTIFTLTVRGPSALQIADHELGGEEVLRNTVRAWILFGGYGSRTRRGLGSLTVDREEALWLPPSGINDPDGFKTELTGLFSTDIFAAQPACSTMEVPVLGRAALFVGEVRHATAKSPDGGAWEIALNWLRDFRQGMTTGARRRPAGGDPEPQRPSLSNWPEADVWRGIKGGQFDHASRYMGQRAYPRAGFGLPVQTRFQRNRRGGGGLREPPDYTLYWHDGVKERDRFGSALIVKALPLRGRMFAPCALWLTRAYPADAKVVCGEQA